ncbi:LOW QUALITY PROTEIN: hypothetical protein PanWU01x14_071060 [Parasponia andersonii]|uniref:Uncharacterized protein n=1 Tax=Parasponia andersonii TaxID=3476 RepID=A0A2P5DEC7_PARAD|nr:LOW QUALITY PROTEIN: hypothetical protein PanWU01x14_071060 [Parasponia andersonii]
MLLILWNIKFFFESNCFEESISIISLQIRESFSKILVG